MRNSIIFKLLAFLLCAASLMGIVGGTAGALVLVEGDLYNRTVDQMLEDRLSQEVSILADQTALAYASRELGGCPSEITKRYGAASDFVYGYAILDAEGKTLVHLHPEMKDFGEIYSVPVTGQYMHLISTETESQALESEARKHLDSYLSESLADTDGELVPAEGIAVSYVIFTGQNGQVLYEAMYDGATGISSTYFYQDYLLDNGTVDSFANTYDDQMGQQTGFLFYNAAGQLAYTSFLNEAEKPLNTTVYGVLFQSIDQNFTFQLDAPEGLGVLSNESGRLLFTSFAAMQASTAKETAPATAPETLPQETAAQTEVTEETHAAETEATVETEETLSEEETASTETSETETTEENKETEETSSASADPEENAEDSDEEKTDPTQETAAQSEAAEADALPAEEEQQDLTEKARNRILFDWLLSRNLITEQTLPADLLTDEQLHEWLVTQNLIDPSQAVPEEAFSEESIPEATEPVLINGKPLETYQINRTEYVNRSTGEHTTAKYIYLPLPELTVELYVDRDSMSHAAVYDVLRMVRQYRGALLPVIGVCLLLFALSAIYLFTAAGCKPRTEKIRAGGLNRLPLDLYLMAGLTVGVIFIALVIEGVPILLHSDFLLGGSLAVVSVFVCCLLFTGFCFAFVAQVKTGSGFWWRNTLSVRFLALLLRLSRNLQQWLQEKGFPWLKYYFQEFWHLFLKAAAQLWAWIGRFLTRIGASLNHFFSLIPMTWQWLLGGLTIILFSLLVNTHHILLIIPGILVPIAIVLYVTHCFGILSDSTKRMSQGNLDTKIDNKLMTGCFKNFAEDLNGLADVSMAAVQKQLKSERMKTELITNVSHDIKTPLTSIINYVDLLQKPHTDLETEQYLEVLNRQSHRLKKLVDDLMDMSKASTGNMTVEITRLDAVESVNQALGEFADKLELAQLTPVFRHSEDSVPIMADGKLVWRVLSNLLSNAVKYAMPGTRIYLDLIHVNKKVIISLKNISREELNVNAEELMERFVRGDVSRNTEGSGLGLNIAKSLMELQKGNLQLLIDGDLFKVALIFPDAP